MHEWGHYIVARRNGVEVEEFGLFFPPRAKVLAKRNGTEYTLNWLPLGGFVKLKGENDADTRPGTFGAATTWVKAKIMLAGVAMNLVTAFVLLTLLAAIGMPKLIDNQFTVASDTKIIKQDVVAGHVSEKSPAEKAGLVRGDVLKSIGKSGQASSDVITSPDDLPKITKKYAGEKVDITYVRAGQKKTTTAMLLTQKEVDKSRNSNQPKGYLGISPTEYTVQRSTWSAPIVAAGLIKQLTLLTFQGLGTVISSLFHGDAQKASEQVSGPIGIFVVMRDGSIFGIEFLLLIIAVISLSLAIMNALPIPALDGGRLFVLLASRALKRPLTKEVEEWIHGVGFLFLIGLIVLISIVDVNRFF